MLLPNGKNPSSPALQSARVLKQALKARKLPPNSFKHVANILGSIDDLVYRTWRTAGSNRFSKRPYYQYDFDHGGWSQLENKPQKFGCFELLHITEQAPDPDNRIVLSGDRDAFGYRQMTIHWRYNDIDQRSVKRAMEIFAEEFEKVGLGRVKCELDHGTPVIWTPSIHHPMGTTRMHESPSQGVVDPNCQVHGVSNLFIASSSVFPTGGYANSTLTVLALAIRLTEHIKATFLSQLCSSNSVQVNDHRST
ncbi:GMC family oxidoreductase [Leptothoe sp. PORK10 BA2]|uniref:GMC family oxidoreductase n=1 Tax=Leptothoe sp. PORK10 BA2 TaxID=3110254 RepID=UPI002B20C9F3|nr:GMC family oxidoreductase [Leptothoe sp. PORK10 BA2]MEA5466707.1 GMC family oxidoreductase [Leptothoe sp. PORK10 BA2]